MLTVKGKQFGGRCDHRLGKGCRTLKPGGGGGLTNEVVVGGRARACVVCLGFQSERLCSLFTCGKYERSTSEGFFLSLSGLWPRRSLRKHFHPRNCAPISFATIGFRRRSLCLLCPPPTPTTHVAYVSLSLTIPLGMFAVGKLIFWVRP